MVIRIPKPRYLLSKLTPPEQPDAKIFAVIEDLTESFDLGTIESCYRAPRSRSLNFIFSTVQGKYVVRQQELSEETVAHEYQVLQFLEKQAYPAPRMLTNRDGKAWIERNGRLFSIYQFVEGYAYANFIWLPSARRKIMVQAGRALADYHSAVEGLTPTAYKWDAYHPTEHKRQREGSLYREALTEIRRQLQKTSTENNVDQFARTHIAEIERMINLEDTVEGCTDLSKIVIHGDYAPWNLLFHKNRPPFVLDFNSARLDLKMFDVILATFFFAWRKGGFDKDSASAFQQGYREAGNLQEADLQLAGDVFQWVMGRSLAERLRSHYLDQRFVIENTAGMERFYKMCVLINQAQNMLVAGLKV